MDNGVYQFQCDNALNYCDGHLKLIGVEVCRIEFHLILPRPYDKKPRFVFWCGVQMGQQLYGEDGIGDDQIWYIAPNATRAVNLQRPTLYLDLV